MWHRTLQEYQVEIKTLLAPLLESLLVTRLETLLVSQDSDRVEHLSITDPHLVGRILAAPVVAHVPVPAFDNSQMDGYAVVAADLAEASLDNPITLTLGVTTAAGDVPGQHFAGTASPIMTGAAIPDGADAVVPVETTLEGTFPRLFRAKDLPITSAAMQSASAAQQSMGVAQQTTGAATFVSPVQPRAFIRFEAEDIATGEIILDTGTRLTPSRIGALAAVGAITVPVRATLKVLLCSTGDELATDTVTLQPGQIFDANTPILMAAFRELDVDVTLLRSGDDPEMFQNEVVDKAHGFDLVVTSGGISKGAYEVVRAALEPLGLSFGTVAIQPGGPQGFGLLDNAAHAAAATAATPVICFPGNPVSALLSFHLFVAPILRELIGLPTEPEKQLLPLAHDVESPANKHQIRRGTVNLDGTVTVLAPGSHLIGDLAEADLLVHFPIGIAHAPATTLVETWRFND